MQLGPTELIIILVIVVLLFGVGRIGKVGKELGSGVRAFREGLQSKEDENTSQEPLIKAVQSDESTPVSTEGRVVKPSEKQNAHD